MITKTRKFITSDSKVAEILRFCIVGGLATVIQYGIYVVFVDVVGVKAVPSTIISYTLSFILNYFLSSYFTFNKRPTAHNLLGFIGSHAVNMGMQTGIVAIFKGIVGDTLALLPAFAICIPLNYLMVRFAFHNNIFKRNNVNNNSNGV